jgi:hypothetical protein
LLEEMQLRRTGAAAGIFVLCMGCDVHVDHTSTARGAKTRIETPLGAIGVEAREGLNPESVGVPVYPGATRDRDNAGGAFVDIGDQQFSVVGASFTTSDSARQVRDFYHERLPHWIFTRKNGEETHIEMSNEGYKRIVAIEERHGRTHIGIVSFGKPGVN